MKQEDKELLLKDLCARLPYDVIVQETFQNFQRDVPVWDCGPHYIKDHLEKVKPYLRPMSSMTNEEKEVVHFFVNNHLYGNCSRSGAIADYLNSIHIDYRGLIEKGLALEAPEGMYKEGGEKK